jgi:cytochrome c peroxidase
MGKGTRDEGRGTGVSSAEPSHLPDRFQLSRFISHISTFIFLLPLLFLTACEKDTPPAPLVQPPSWFPELHVPVDNQLTASRIALGRRLFHDSLLSRDSSISCASCHLQSLAFTDGRPVAIGVEGRMGQRNAPTLTNVAYVPELNADGGIPTLELQAQAPIFAHEEMDFTIAGFLERIADDATYTAQFQTAYGRKPDAFGISRGLAAFQRTFISGNSRFDRFEYLNDVSALSEAEQRGRELFFGIGTQCSECHAPPLFTTFEYANIGLYESYADSGRARITHLPQDNGKFRVPSLRNIALTAPYMHDGTIGTLRGAVEHFNAGGSAHPNRDGRIRPLHLTPQQVDDLVAFLESLTDEGFVNEPGFSAP